jgi:branched-chain amino acid transport system ATP-binding protein
MMEASDNMGTDKKPTSLIDRLTQEHPSVFMRLVAKITGRKPIMTHALPDDMILNVDDLSMVFGGLRAVDHLSFSLKKNQIYGLIGPNGAGKTTVFNCITQFYKSNTGHIFFRTPNGTVIDLNDIRVDDVIKLGLTRTFQNVELIKDLTILENVLIGSHTEFTTSLFDEIFRTRKNARQEAALVKKAEEILEFLGIGHLKQLFAMALPYGIAKKVELARTLMSGPSLIILDEPAAGLNEEETLELANTLRTIRDKYGCTILLVEHDMRLVMDVCDEICAISFGKLLAIGNPQQIQKNPVVQEAYLGKADA